MGTRAPRMPSIVEGFCRLPSPVFAAESVAPAACHLAHAAARALLAGIRVDAQNESRHATTPDEPAVVEPVGKWPRYVVQELPRHDGRSDSPVQ
jgi:hypothetical protein